MIDVAIQSDPVRLTLGFRPDVRLADESDGGLRIEHPWAAYRLRGLTADERSLLAELGRGQVAAERVVPHPRVRSALDTLAPVICQTITVGGRRLAGAIPMAAGAKLRPIAAADAETVVRLSRFAYLRRAEDDRDTVLESPLSQHRVILHDPAVAALVAALARPVVVRDAARAVPALPIRAVDTLVKLLIAVHIADPGTEPGDQSLELWDFHDLLFHARSRAGRHDHPFGGLFRHRDRLPPLPPVRPPHPGAPIELPRPAWGEVVAGDPTLTDVLETRRSVREYNDVPLTLAQLARLLYRAARARRVIPADPDGGMPYDALDRPFPTGGASGELELYLTVARCQGLDPGAYHYDAAAHALHRLAASERHCQELLTYAWRAAAGRVRPQVLLTITSRFGRVSWKYSSIAYALTLKHVGVLYQTLYLVATAMGLAPCALGSGDADAAARAFGLDWASESSVGEFLIGSPDPNGPGPATGFIDIVEESRAPSS
jgi:SagB-type dehydrogenase family enzyme